MGRDGTPNDLVASAVAILRDAGFPVEQIRVLPAEEPGIRAEDEADDTPLDRQALADACCAILADGEPRAAKDLARLVRPQVGVAVNRKDVNSVLSREAKDRVVYDRERFTYRLRK